VTPTTAANVTANIVSGSITGFTVVSGGNYPGNPTLAVFIFDSGGGSGATATASLKGTAVNAVTTVTGGSGYTTNTYVTVAPTAILSGVSPTVTAVCGVPAQGTLCGLGYSNPNGSKAGTTTLQNQPPRCFNMYYGSDGPTNRDPIVDWIHGGGGVGGSPDDAYVLPAGSNPGVVPTIVNRGNKFNFYAHAYALAAVVKLSSMNATTTTAVVSNAGPQAFPTSYTSCFNLQAVNDGTGVVETMKVTGISGSGPWTYSVVRGMDCLGNPSTPGSHTVNGQYAWFTDGNGNSPTYPAGFNDTECFAAFLVANAGNGQIPGNGMDIRLIGFSHGTAHVYVMRALGTQLYNPANCEWPQPSSTPFTTFAGISGVFDWAAISNMTSICSQTGNCSANGGMPSQAQDGSEPFLVGATAGAAAWGSNGPNPTNNSVSVGTCGANGLAVVDPSSANTIVSEWSPQSYWSGGQCASGGGHCWGTPVNPLPPAFIATGFYDGDVSANTQDCFVSQVPGVTQLTVTGTCDGRRYADHFVCTLTWSSGDGQHYDSNSPALSALVDWIGGESFAMSASPASLSITLGNQGTSTITTEVSGSFDSPISLSASGVPSGTSVSFEPNPIPAPGAGTSTMTIMVSGTLPGTYPITVTANGGGFQQNATVTLTVTLSAGQQSLGFDFRNTAGFVTDLPGDTYVLSTTAYPTNGNGVTYGWVRTSLVQARDRNSKLDPRLAGINFVNNGAPATFYVDLPSSGTYDLALAMGDASWPECMVQCQIQFLDGSTVLATVTGGLIGAGSFYDAQGNDWSAASWPIGNLSQQVTLTGTRLTMVVGTNQATGDFTPIAFLGVTQVSGGSPNFTLSASPASVSVVQGNQGTSTITTTISGGFSSAISLSASGVPSGTTVSFNPQTIPAPGSGSSTMSITVGSSTPTGTYPITVTGNGGGIQQNTTVTLTVTAAPNFTISASPASLSIQQGNQGTSTITTTISGGFNSDIALSASGMPSGTTVSFNPNPIPAPGSGSSAMTIIVGSSTPTGTYPLTVTGNGGGIQQNTNVDLTVTGASGSGVGFDFRNTKTFVTDPPAATYVLPSTAYPTTVNGVTFGWVKTSLVQGRDRRKSVDARLAGINFASNGSPATFYVDLPSPGIYNLSLAMGDDGWQECWVQCQIQFLDGSAVLATVTGALIGAGNFYDATGKVWLAANWPTSNLSQQVTLTGTRLTMMVGTSNASGDFTTIAFLGVTQ
jgi:hypothetical protein